MSEAMIIRKGGGSGKLSPNNAILRVVTSTGCSVTISNSTAGYSKTHADSDGFAWSSDANVKDHFFNIPSTAFGTITVTATNTYGTNTKTLTVNTAGKVYEALVSAPNIILNSTFGLQSGYSPSAYWSYSLRDKSLTRNSTGGSDLFSSVTVGPYSTLTVTGVAESMENNYLQLIDQDSVVICSILNYTINPATKTGTITNKFYPTAKLWVALKTITEIVLS